jgi:hypothetical protein
VTSAGQLSLADRLKLWWLNRLDSDSVRDFIAPYCSAWLAWAILATFWFPPISTISESMGLTTYYLWVWAAIPANLAPIIGLWMRHGGAAIAEMSNRLLFRDWMGLIFQATGHATCFILLVLFEVSAWTGAYAYDGPLLYAGMTIFAGMMLIPWTCAVALLCAQCIRKIQIGMRLDRLESAR